MKDFHHDYYIGIKGVYFYRILDKIIKLGNLDKRDIKILDYGCGLGKLKQKLGDKVIGYDILPELSEIEDWKKKKFDVVVANELFYLFSEEELRSFLNNLKKLNKDTELIVGISRQGTLNRIAALLGREKDAHSDTHLSPKNQLKILKEQMCVLNKGNVFFMCDIFRLKFK